MLRVEHNFCRLAASFFTVWILNITEKNNWNNTLAKRTAVAQWLRCCATNRKVAGSIPDGVIGIFHWHNPSDRIMGSTQPLTEMSTRRISWGKCGRCVRLTTLPPPCAVVMKSVNLNFLEPSGPLQACNGTDLPFISFRHYNTWCSFTSCFSASLANSPWYSFSPPLPLNPQKAVWKMATVIRSIDVFF